MNFNSHAHVERDFGLVTAALRQKISTHTLTWSVTYKIMKITGVKNFNSHAHVERDHFASGLTNEQLNFNSHAHVERDILVSIYHFGGKYFNSHAHVERD